MRNLLAFLGGLLVAFLALGWYLDWYQVARQASPTPGVYRLQFDVNPGKVADDVSKGVQAGRDRITGAIERLPEKKADETPAKADTPAPAPPAPPAPQRTP